TAGRPAGPERARRISAGSERNGSLLFFLFPGRSEPWSAAAPGDVSLVEGATPPAPPRRYREAPGSALRRGGALVVASHAGDQALRLPIRQAISNAWRVAPTSALPCPAISKAVPWAGVAMG